MFLRKGLKSTFNLLTTFRKKTLCNSFRKYKTTDYPTKKINYKPEREKVYRKTTNEMGR